MLQPRTAILRPRSRRLWWTTRQISSSSGRLRRKKVPRYCRRGPRRTRPCRNRPYTVAGAIVVTEGGRRRQAHSLRRRYAPRGDLPGTFAAAIVYIRRGTSCSETGEDEPVLLVQSRTIFSRLLVD